MNFCLSQGGGGKQIWFLDQYIENPCSVLRIRFHFFVDPDGQNSHSVDADADADLLTWLTAVRKMPV